MRGTLFYFQRLALSTALCVGLCHLVMPGGDAQNLPVSAPSLDAQSLEAVTLSEEDRDTSPAEVAHHVGSTGASTIIGVSSSSALSTTGGGGVTTSSDSLWGNMLLSMAYQRDPEIQRLAKKLGRVNSMVMMSIAGVSALGIVQSTLALNDLHGDEAVEVTPAHGPGERDHVHIHGESKTPAVMGIVGSGVTLATLGIRAVLNKRYTHRLEDRQFEIKAKVEGILAQLKAGQPFETVHPTLTELVGPVATEEFQQIWQATHPQ